MSVLLAAFLTLSTSPVVTPPDDDEFAGITSVDTRADDDENKRYFLIGSEGAKAPKKGFKLLLVLPGGNGSADFEPFVKRIYKNALNEEYLAAQLVAPVWAEDQAESLVWPTDEHEWKGMEFSTEDFIASVIADVEKEHEIDPSYIFTLGWSSGGPPIYSYSLRKKTRVTGTFVAMSVFKPNQLPSLKAAKGQAYFLLHSPDDFIPIAMAEEAEKQLKKKKAKVELLTYPGGHGWRGNVWGNIKAGIAFLEKNHGKPAKRPKR